MLINYYTILYLWNPSIWLFLLMLHINVPVKWSLIQCLKELLVIENLINSVKYLTIALICQVLDTPPCGVRSECKSFKDFFKELLGEVRYPQLIPKILIFKLIAMVQYKTMLFLGGTLPVRPPGISVTKKAPFIEAVQVHLCCHYLFFFISQKPDRKSWMALGVNIHTKAID